MCTATQSATAGTAARATASSVSMKWSDVPSSSPASSRNRCACWVRLWSWMSVAVPIQKSIAPSAPRIGTARPRCQRYVPSAARKRYSTSKASPEASVSARFATAAGRSSGCTASVQPFSPACSTDWPVYSNQRRL